MESRECTLTLLDNLSDDGRYSSPEQSISTPSYEYQSGFKRLRTEREEGFGFGGNEPMGERPAADEALMPSTADTVVPTDTVILELQDEVRTVCSELGDVVLRLRSKSEWNAEKDQMTARKRELRLQLREIERRLANLETTKQVDSLRRYIAFCLEKAHPVTQMNDLMDDELQLILSRVPLTNGSPKQLLALSLVSKRFRRLIRQPAVWCDLDLSSHASFLTDRVVLNVVKNDGAFSLLRRVCLSGCTRVTDAAVCKLLSFCGSTLQHLDLQGCTLLKTKTVLHAATVCHNLTYLDLYGCTGVDAVEALKLPAKHWPKMQSMNLMNTSALSGRVPEKVFMRLANAVEDFIACQHMVNASGVNPSPESAAATDSQIPCQVCPPEAGGSSKASSAINLGELPEFVAMCKSRVENWYEGLPMAACDHAVVMQGENNGGPERELNLLPNCGHVLCVECEQKARSGMVRRHGDNEYVYPCPQQHACGEYMPCPGGFEITLQQ